MKKNILLLLIASASLFACRNPNTTVDPPVSDPLDTLIPQSETELENADYCSLLPDPALSEEYEISVWPITIMVFAIDYYLDDIIFDTITFNVEREAYDDFSVEAVFSSLSVPWSADYIITNNSNSDSGYITGDLVTVSMDVSLTESAAEISGIVTVGSAYSVGLPSDIYDNTADYFGVDLADYSIQLIEYAIEETSTDIIRDIFETFREDLLSYN